MGGGLGGPSRPLMPGQGLDLLDMGMDFGGMKQEAPDGPDVSNCSVYLPTCTSHLFLACVLLRHAYDFPLPYDAHCNKCWHLFHRFHIPTTVKLEITPVTYDTKKRHRLIGKIQCSVCVDGPGHLAQAQE